MPLSTAGSALLDTALVLALLGSVLGLVRPGDGRLRLLQWLTFLASLPAFLVLMALVARADPTVAYAVEHAAPAGAGLGYRLAAVWAGQAGGLLLWCVETALVGLFMLPVRMPRAVAVMSALEACLLGLVVVNNPFAPAAAGAVGGLNPMLQAPMMLIHPPMLFLGYALLAAPYAITIGALADRDAEGWPKAVWPWVLVAWLALTLGNGFGAEWAYKTFGWGGFWSWDPVENTSFVPWMLVAAGIHCLWMARRRGAWLRPAAVCIVGAFIAVLYGSYLARSGALSGASVHAYVAGEKLMQYALGGLLVGATVLVAALLIPRWREWETAAQGDLDDPVTRATRNGIDAMAAVSALVLVGMSLPMLGSAPTTSAYNTAVMPLALVMMVMLLRTGGWALGGTMRWVARVVVALWLIATWGMALMYGSTIDGGPGMIIQALCAPPLLLTACLVALQSVGQILGGSVSWKRIGPPLAHLGLAAMLIGALGSGFGTATEKAYLALGQEQQVLGHRVVAKDVSLPAPEVRRANLVVDGTPGRVEMETSKLFDISLRRALIRRSLVHDFYVTPIAIVVEPLQMGPHTVPPGAMIEVAVKPVMSLVWLGMLSIAAGLLLALMRRLTASADRSA